VLRIFTKEEGGNPPTRTGGRGGVKRSVPDKGSFGKYSKDHRPGLPTINGKTKGVSFQLDRTRRQNRNFTSGKVGIFQVVVLSEEGFGVICAAW